MNFHSLKQSFIDIQNDQQKQQQNIESIPFQLLKRFIQKNDEKKLHFLELEMCFVDIHMYIAMIAKKISSKLKNTSLNRFDDYMVYNETLKQTIYWTVYGDNNEYFLSKKYDFEDDFLEPLKDSEEILINAEINEENNLENFIEKSKKMGQ